MKSLPNNKNNDTELGFGCGCSTKLVGLGGHPLIGMLDASWFVSRSNRDRGSGLSQADSKWYIECERCILETVGVYPALNNVQGSVHS